MKEIKLTLGKVALVDDDVFEYLNQWKWCAHKQHKTYYAVRCIIIDGKKGIQKMHRLLLNVNDPKVFVDHKDRNGLNNTMQNIRIATPSDNMKNKTAWGSSKYLGVKWNSLGKNWRAGIKVNRKDIHLGVFKKEEDAALAYNEAAKIHHKEFANLNTL